MDVITLKLLVRLKDMEALKLLKALLKPQECCETFNFFLLIEIAVEVNV